MADKPHRNEGTATDGMRSRNGLNRGKLVSPKELAGTCVSDGQHFRCVFLERMPGKEDNVKAPRIWCGQFGVPVVVISRKQQRCHECRLDTADYC